MMDVLNTAVGVMSLETACLFYLSGFRVSA